MEARVAGQVLFWGLAALGVWGLHREPRARPAGRARAPVRRSGVSRREARLAGLVLGALCARIGWLAVHASGLSEAAGATAGATAGASGGLRALLGAPSGASVLFAPLGPVLVRALRRDPRARLDGDLRAWVPGLAVARLGCAFAGCCGGRGGSQADLLATAGLSWLVGREGFAYPVALLECLGLAALWAVCRRPGRGGLGIAGFGALRLGLAPLRAAPPHGGPTGWVAWVAGAWVAFGVLSMLVMLAPRVRGGRSWARARRLSASNGRGRPRPLRSRRLRRSLRAARRTPCRARPPPLRRQPASAR